MQDEINEKVVALSIKGGKLTAATLRLCCRLEQRPRACGTEKLP